MKGRKEGGLPLGATLRELWVGNLRCQPLQHRHPAKPGLLAVSCAACAPASGWKKERLRPVWAMGSGLMYSATHRRVSLQHCNPVPEWLSSAFIQTEDLQKVAGVQRGGCCWPRVSPSSVVSG